MDEPALWERWRPVVGYEGRYLVSDKGDVESLRYRIHLKGQVNRKGYPVVHLYKNGKARSIPRATLVAEAFIGPRPEGMQVCHNDGNPANSTVINLRWDTPRANALDRQEHGTDYQLNKEQCAHDHPYTEENTYIVTRRDGRRERQCKTCHRASDKRRRSGRN